MAIITPMATRAHASSLQSSAPSKAYLLPLTICIESLSVSIRIIVDKSLIEVFGILQGKPLSNPTNSNNSSCP